MEKERENYNKADLPAASLKLDPETIALIESSRVKSFIAPLIVKAHRTKSQKISILAWDSDKLVRTAAKALTVALSQQLDRKCALVIPEGIRVSAESFESLSIITLPEVDLPNSTAKLAAFTSEMDRIYPFQIFVGPSIKEWAQTSSTKFRMALSAHAQVLIAPEKGFSRTVARQIAKFSAAHKLNWLGVISVSPTTPKGEVGHA